MLIPVAKQYTAEITGQTRKEVTCENCGAGYSYEMRRTAHAGASTGLLDSGADAANLARQRAHDRLMRQLARHCNPVRCPRCRWLQRDMLREVRRRALIRWSLAAVVLLLTWLVWEASTNPDGGSAPPEPKKLAVGIALVVAYLAVVGWVLLRDLNRGLRLNSAAGPSSAADA